MPRGKAKAKREPKAKITRKPRGRRKVISNFHLFIEKDKDNWEFKGTYNDQSEVETTIRKFIPNKKNETQNPIPKFRIIVGEEKQVTIGEPIIPCEIN